MRVVVYTADVGGYDEVWEPTPQEGPQTVSFVRFSDVHPNRGATRWDNVPAFVHPDYARGNDRLAGRWYKTHPHVLFPEADLTIWVDSCLEIVSPHFVSDVAGTWGQYLAIDHPDRDNVFDEIEAAETLRKYDGNRHREMVEEYAQTIEGLRSARLRAMTVLARRNYESVRAMDAIVWGETVRWSTSGVTALDQLILPYAERIVETGGIDVLRPPHPTNPYEYGTLWANAWFRRHPHRRET